MSSPFDGGQSSYGKRQARIASEVLEGVTRENPWVMRNLPSKNRDLFR